jgi:hypothetical protein
MLTLFLALFVGSANAKDPVVYNPSYVPHQPLSRPAAQLNCPEDTALVGRVSARHAVPLLETCIKAKEVEVDQTRADADLATAKYTGAAMYHVTTKLADDGATSEFYFGPNGEVATGRSATYAAASQNGAFGFGSGNGFVVGRSFAQFDSLDALDGNGGSSGGLTVPAPKPAPKPAATAPAPQSAEQLAKDLEKTQAKAAEAIKERDALRAAMGCDPMDQVDGVCLQ